MNGEWLIGDFGLVEYPTKDAFTTGERAPGAFHYLAPECLLDPNVPAGPVDVYALAKTLWVLGSNQRLPLQGHLNASFEPLRLGTFSPHLRIRQIEMLLDRATHPTPESRPTMSQVANELEAWLSPQQTFPVVINDAALANRATAIINANVAIATRRKERWDRSVDLCSRAEAVFRDSLLPALARFGVEAKMGGSKQVSDVTEVAELRARQERIYSCHPTCSVATQVFGAPNQPTIELLGGLEIQVEESGDTTVLAYWALFDTERQLKTLWSRTRNASTISAEEERELSAILQEFSGALPEAVASYVDRLQELGG